MNLSEDNIKDEENEINNDNHHSETEEIYEGVNKRLSDLMQRGWIMLAESCSLDSCKCPLMRSPDGQKYCCGCEMWQFDNKPRQKKKFGEVILYKGNRQNQENSTQVSKPLNKDKLYNLSSPILQTLNMKLSYLNQKLINETDLHMIKVIVNDMNLIMDAIQKCKNLN